MFYEKENSGTFLREQFKTEVETFFLLCNELSKYKKFHFKMRTNIHSQTFHWFRQSNIAPVTSTHESARKRPIRANSVLPRDK